MKPVILIPLALLGAVCLYVLDKAAAKKRRRRRKCAD